RVRASSGNLWQSFPQQALELVRLSPPTWRSAIFSSGSIFLLGYPILASGLSFSGVAAALLLGTITWRAFGPPGFLLVAVYFIIGTAATKVKMAQKEAEGVAEKKRGRRGPSSVIGSSAAAIVCSLLSIYTVGGKAHHLWTLGFVANFCTKLSDTVSSEIGKAYGKTTYLVTTLKKVPRGTEGAISVEGTVAGLLSSVLLAFIGCCLLGQISLIEGIACVVASQLANLGESFIGALLQDREGTQWLNNDVVNVINISMGSIFAILIWRYVLQTR
ncbi:hypothetical protein M569_01380, partial [Genlisea aurea]